MSRRIYHCLMITLGGAIQGSAMGVFLFPHFIPSGGAGGLAVLLNHFILLPMSIALWIVNFSLLVAAIKWLGNASALGTMYSITVTSIFVNLVELESTRTFSNVWIDLLIGGAILGIGIGILLRQNVSNGGMGVLALIFAKKKGIAPGKLLFWLNGSIFLLTASIIAWEIIIQALICHWISTRAVDVVYHFRLQTVSVPSFSYRNKR